MLRISCTRRHSLRGTSIGDIRTRFMRGSLRTTTSPTHFAPSSNFSIPNTTARSTQERKAPPGLSSSVTVWGASETVNFARELGRRGIPVLLTIQVDSIEKSGEDDAIIPPNVLEAINFYQTRGWLHGRRLIQAQDPEHTEILGNYESDYRNRPVSLSGFSWCARALMKPHIEIENDGALWDRIETLILARLRPTGLTTASRSDRPSIPTEPSAR